MSKSDDSLGASAVKGESDFSLTASDMSKGDGDMQLIYPVSISSKDLHYSAQRRVCSSYVDILRGISLIAEAGEMIGILGPSGCGKTTLLNCLCQRNRISKLNESSQVLYNGQMLPQYEARRFLNFVPAKDRLLPYLTVEETLHFAVRLRTMGCTKKEQKEKVDSAIDAMRLNLVRNTYVGGEWKKGISSGELKRLSIAMELLDDPSVLLLDEPTSGLDSNLALEVILSLRGIANQNRTVVCSIHQPRSQVFQMFDKILLMARGRILYFGPPSGAKDYFGELGYPCPMGFNPADHLVEIASGDGGSPLTDVCAVSDADETCKGSEKDISSVNLSAAPPTSEISMDVTVSVKSVRQTHAAVRLSDSELEALADAYETSDAAAQCDARISEIEATKSELPQLRGSWVKTCASPSTYSSWFVEFSTLWKRSATNSARNPIVFVVMLLVMMMTGLILGGIFFQLPAPIKGVEPLGELDSTFRTNPWFRWFAYGVDGNGSKPLLDILDNGVDGQGSRPLAGTSEPGTPGSLHNLVQCSYDKYVEALAHPTFYPPNDFPVPSEWPTGLPESSNAQMASHLRRMLDELADGTAKFGDDDVEAYMDSTEFDLHPNDIIGDVVSVFQILDWLWFNTDYNAAKECIGRNLAIRFYTCVQSEWAQFLDPVLTCGGLPPIAEALPGLAAAKSDKFEFRRLSLEDRAVNSAVLSTFNEVDQYLDNNVSGGGRLVYEATLQLGGRILDICGEPCKSLSTIVDGTVSYGSDILDTVLVVINVAGGLFFLSATLGFASYEALLTFPQERAIFNHERANGMYRASSYYLAKNMADLFFQLVPSLSMVTIYYWMVGLNPTVNAFFGCFFVAGATSFAAYGFGYMISALSPRMEVSVCIAPMVLVVYLVLCGFFLRDEDIPSWIGWAKFLSIYRWGFFGFVTNQWPKGETFGALPNEVIHGLCGVVQSSLMVNVFYLVMLGFGYRFVGFLGLKYTNRKAGIDV